VYKSEPKTPHSRFLTQIVSVRENKSGRKGKEVEEAKKEESATEDTLA